MYCQKCGIQNADDASFCSKCGNDIGKLKSIPIEKTTFEQLPKSSRLLSVLRWIVGIWLGLGGLFEIILLGEFGAGILIIIISIIILPINKSIAGKSKSQSENKKEYKKIDVRELTKNVSKFIDQKIKISGEVNWIEERDGNTFLIISAAVPHVNGKNGYSMLLGYSIYIECIGSIPIFRRQKVDVFGVVKGKHEISYIAPEGNEEVPFIFATSISRW